VLQGSFANEIRQYRDPCLQCDTSCCGVLQCVAEYCGVLQCVVVCCRVLQCVAVCCGVLQCVAVCRSLLQGSFTSETRQYKGGRRNLCFWCLCFLFSMSPHGDLFFSISPHLDLFFFYFSSSRPFCLFRVSSLGPPYTAETRSFVHVSLQHTATHCNILQHTATHCNTLRSGETRKRLRHFHT